MWLPWLIFTERIGLYSQWTPTWSISKAPSGNRSCRQPETSWRSWRQAPDLSSLRGTCTLSFAREGSSLRGRPLAGLCWLFCGLCRDGVLGSSLTAVPPHAPVTAQLSPTAQKSMSTQVSISGTRGTWPQGFRFGSTHLACQFKGIRFRLLTLAAK